LEKSGGVKKEEGGPFGKKRVSPVMTKPNGWEVLQREAEGCDARGGGKARGLSSGFVKEGSGDGAPTANLFRSTGWLF